MHAEYRHIKPIVTSLLAFAFACAVSFPVALAAQGLEGDGRDTRHFGAPSAAEQGLGGQADIDALYERLQDPELTNWETVEDDIWAAWARSGSPSIDLLLRRGQDALEAGETDVAIEHFTAAIDHAPGFAEAYNGRATAFFQAERYGQSMADIEMTLALNPRHFGALTGLAMILEALDQPQDALSAYRAVSAIHPHRPNVREAIDRLEVQLEGRAL